MSSEMPQELDRRERRAALAAFVAELEEQYGEPDPAELEHFRQLLGPQRWSSAPSHDS